MWTTTFFKSCFKNILSYMNGRLSKICSVHTYVMPRTVYFGWICRFYLVAIQNFLVKYDYNYHQQIARALEISLQGFFHGLGHDIAPWGAFHRKQPCSWFICIFCPGFFVTFLWLIWNLVGFRNIWTVNYATFTGLPHYDHFLLFSVVYIWNGYSQNKSL